VDSEKALLVIVPLLLGGAARAETIVASKTFPRADIRAVSVTTENGFIELRGTASGDAKVEALKPAGSKGHCRLVVDASGGKLSLQARRPDGGVDPCDAGFRVSFPRGSAVEAYSGSGAVTLEDARGESKIRTGAGNVRLDRVEAPLHVMTGGGDVSGEDPKLPWLDVRTGGGKVTLSLGAIRSTISVRTGSGAIALTLPRGAKARVKAESPGGGVRNEVPSAADAPASIEALSGSGPVVVRTR